MTRPEELTAQQCWELLERHELARVGYQLDGQVHVLPINYGLQGQALIFATAPGSKLQAVLTGHDMTIEVDEVVDEVGRSVVLRGRGEVVPEEEHAAMSQVRVRPWVATGAELAERGTYVRLVPTELTGRAYQLHRPWTSIRRAEQ